MYPFYFDVHDTIYCKCTVASVVVEGRIYRDRVESRPLQLINHIKLIESGKQSKIESFNLKRIETNLHMIKTVD